LLTVFENHRTGNEVQHEKSKVENNQRQSCGWHADKHYWVVESRN